VLERIFVAGTDTGVGKTWITKQIVMHLRDQGLKVSARKPVQSFDPTDATTDADELAAATGEPVDRVCPKHRSYAVPLAPPMAAEQLDREPIALAELVAETHFEPGVMSFIEGVGGLRSPLADDADSVDLCFALGAELVLLVSDSGLGSINRVHLSAAAVKDLPLLVVLNRYDAADETHRLNRDWLVDDGLDLVTSTEEAAQRILRRHAL